MFSRTALRVGVLALAATAAAGATIAPAFADVPPIQYGAHGPQVGCVQRAMNLLDSANLRVDDKFGLLTQAAVKTYRSHHGLRPDGSVGDDTGGSIKTNIATIATIENHAGRPGNVYDVWLTDCDNLVPPT